MKEILKSDLASADPVSGGADAKLHEFVRQMAFGAQEAVTAESPARTPWWKRRRTMIPLGIAGVVALSAAAWLVPLSEIVNGTPVKLDAEIPINYTTDTGVDVSCRYGIYIGDPAHRSAADERVAKFVETHDWSAIGQRIYKKAIANPFVPGPGDDEEVDTQASRDTASFDNATDLIWNEIPSDVRAGVQSAGMTSDCTGQLR